MRGYLRGHPVEWDPVAGCWRDAETGNLVDLRRACRQCGKKPTAAGHDTCIGDIPGAASACCGHGVHVGYVNWPGIPAPAGWWRGAYVGGEGE